MISEAASVAEYLASLPEDRRAVLQAVRKVILDNLDKDYQECMQYGMIGYSVPHSVYPAGYHCDPKQPLPFGGLASQKNHMSLYLMCTYLDKECMDWLQKAWANSGKKLDMGKSCIRFKSLADLPLDVIGEAIRQLPAREFIRIYESVLNRSATKSSGKNTKKPSKKRR